MNVLELNSLIENMYLHYHVGYVNYILELYLI